MRAITSALAIFFILTSSFHFFRMLLPDVLGPQSHFVQTHLVHSPPLSSIRLPGGQLHIDESYPKRPVLIYGLHLLPGFLWLALAPLQFNYRLRNKQRALHRASGYVFFSLSALLDLSGFTMIAVRFSYSHPDRWTLLFGLLPTFDVALTILGVLFAFPLVLALRGALKRNFDLHRLWVIVHVGVGLTIPYQRVFMYTQFSLSNILSRWAPDLFERVVGLPSEWARQHRTAIGERELAAFAITGYLGMLAASATTAFVLRPIMTSKRPKSV